jgi:uncharacterized phage infection (PIP) family protein YhgE
MEKDKKNEIEQDPKLRNQIPIHKKSSSYGGYGGNSPANMDGAINEFEDNLEEEAQKKSEDEEIANKKDNSEEQESENLDPNRAEGFDRVKNGPKKTENKKK